MRPPSPEGRRAPSPENEQREVCRARGKENELHDFHGRSISFPLIAQTAWTLAWLWGATLVYSYILKKLQNCVLRELFIVTITELTNVNITDKLYLVK